MSSKGVFFQGCYKLGLSDRGLNPFFTEDGSYVVNPLPDDKILDSSKLKEFADDNFKFEENGRKFSKRVENTTGKGEIARYEQFLLFIQCF